VRAVLNFIVKPLNNSRYNNEVKVGDKELIVNSDNFQHQFVNREAEVLAVPTVGDTNIQVGDKVIVHHNVFRVWKNMRGVEQNSKSYYKDNTYFVFDDQIFLYKNKNTWKANKGFCFVQPIESNDMFSEDKEKPLIGIMKYPDEYLTKANVKAGDLVGFKPNTEYEFIIDDQKLYRIFSNSITIKYEYQGNEKEYNPSWT
jgi:hypothetical protein|tara:strand:+ start:1629 stop:2228 length:600 start_codon:yes stop_codon:yes gene_type:complete